MLVAYQTCVSETTGAASRSPNYIRNTQELSYRKQIRRQLRTQYVKGIYNTVTF